MINAEELTKVYYTIGEVAALFDVSTSLIRYWEGEFPSLKTLKNKKGDRRFTKDQIMEFNKIYSLVKVKGFTLEGAKNALQEEKQHARAKKNTLNKMYSLKKGLIHLREKI